MKKALRVVIIGAGTLAVLAACALAYLFLKFPDAGAVPDIAASPTPERLARGAYLTKHVAVCLDCHSTRNWALFSGPLVPGTEGKGGERFDESIGFPGIVIAKNITPAGIGRMSDGQIFHAITSGIGQEERALFPLMPYLAYNELTPEDLVSIIAYIRSLPPIPNEVPASTLNFPLNLLVRTMPVPYTPKTTPNPNNAFEYGKYMTTMASCITCHTQEVKGERVKGMDFAGGRKFPLPNGVVHTANITPDEETGIGLWTKEIFVAKFKEFENADSTKLDLTRMGRQTVMPWTMYAGMTENDLGAIYEYLRTVLPVKNKVEVWIEKK